MPRVCWGVTACTQPSPEVMKRLIQLCELLMRDGSTKQTLIMEMYFDPTSQQHYSHNITDSGDVWFLHDTATTIKESLS